MVAGNQNHGIRGLQRASISLSVDPVIEDNKRPGVSLDGGSIVWAAKTSTIQHNGGNRIEAFDTSSVWAFIGTGATIRDNSGWGLWCQPGPANDARIRPEGSPAASAFGNGAGQVSCPGHMLP